MSKVTLDIEDFKALASETRLDILRAIDQRNMSLKDISQVTKLHETTVHEHLTKLVRSGFVKKNEREGHKWVYYKLSWKGSSLLHPDNTKVVVMFTSTFAIFLGSIFGLLYMLRVFGRSKVETAESMGSEFPKGGAFGASNDPFILFLTFFCLILFCIFMIISIRMFQKNKSRKL
jgi:DNA-binding transcriptional ArsR family regulator